jgi:hypothetical protein
MESIPAKPPEADYQAHFTSNVTKKGTQPLQIPL